jgi:hypothetical protein
VSRRTHNWRTGVKHLEAALAERLREIRSDCCGEHGTDFVARSIGAPPQTWQNYEASAVIPGVAILKFIDLTTVNPHWLLTGHGPKYLDPVVGSRV